MSLLANLALRRPRNIDASTLGRDAMAGAISAVVQIAYCISFAALIFTGDLASGFSARPCRADHGHGGHLRGDRADLDLLAGDRRPGLAGRRGDERARRLDRHRARRQGREHADTIIINVLVALSVSTLLTGVLLYGVGALKLGQWLRFIPYPVIGGFLAASGILLITGGMEVVTQTNLTLSPSSWAGAVFAALRRRRF